MEIFDNKIPDRNRQGFLYGRMVVGINTWYYIFMEKPQDSGYCLWHGGRVNIIENDPKNV